MTPEAHVATDSSPRTPDPVPEKRYPSSETPEQFSSSRSLSPSSKRCRDNAICGDDCDLAKVVQKLRLTMLTDSEAPFEARDGYTCASHVDPDEGTDFGWLCYSGQSSSAA